MDSITAEWVKYSERALASAKYLYTMNPPPHEEICNLCQQSAEKILKAFLICSGINPKKTHDLEELRNECENMEKSFNTIIKECARLTDYAVKARYPFEITILDSDSQNSFRRRNRSGAGRW
ncbi:MAG: HEPN domain-containing protein [Oscillospiraceae bacterium]|nr:HEPN domain-containing protein [Oscillospiraceae bacterium]